VVHLHHQGDAIPAEAFDHRHFPQGAVPGERAAGDLPDGGRQREVAAWSGHAQAEEMTIDIEIWIVDPIRSTDAQWDGRQFPASRRDGWHPIDHHGSDGLEGVAPGHGGGVEEKEPAYVEVHGRGLAIEEHCVQAAELLHETRIERFGALGT